MDLLGVGGEAEVPLNSAAKSATDLRRKSMVTTLSGLEDDESCAFYKLWGLLLTAAILNAYEYLHLNVGAAEKHISPGV